MDQAVVCDDRSAWPAWAHSLLDHMAELGAVCRLNVAEVDEAMRANPDADLFAPGAYADALQAQWEYGLERGEYILAREGRSPRASRARSRPDNKKAMGA